MMMMMMMTAIVLLTITIIITALFHLRYQYLNLIHFLHYDSWDDESYPPLDNEREWDRWDAFHIGNPWLIIVLMLLMM